VMGFDFAKDGLESVKGREVSSIPWYRKARGALVEMGKKLVGQNSGS
jgi:hypothetical protein